MSAPLPDTHPGARSAKGSPVTMTAIPPHQIARLKRRQAPDRA